MSHMDHPGSSFSRYQFSPQSQTSPFDMAAAENHNKSVAESSFAMGNSRSANYANNRFASVAEEDSDDQEERGGGVNLRDFDEDGNAISTPRATASGNGGAPLHGYGSLSSQSTPIGKPAPSSRRNTIAPIGSGRFAEYKPSTSDATVSGAIDATIDAIINAKANGFRGQAESTAQASTPNSKYRAGPNQHQSGMTPNVYPQMNTARGIQYASNQGANGQASTPSSSANPGPMPQHAQGISNTAYTYGSTPTNYTNNAGAYTAQHQGTGLGAGFSRMNMATTPSHAPKPNANNNQTATPYGANPTSYHQTEPRNFAPRVGAAPFFLPPPPPFKLGGGAATKQHHGSQATMSESDPFSTPSSPARTVASASSQALALTAVPENDQLSLVCNPYIYGPVPVEIRAVRSQQLNQLTEGALGVPTQDVALNPDNFPFIESCSQAEAVSHGVVKIRNIPFGTKRAELIAFLGRNSKILNDNQEPVHIIMERVSSKTQDAYVEFLTLYDAMRAVDRHTTEGQRGRTSRLGDRPVDVQLSSQSALMKDLFPLAAGVMWDGSKPVIQAPIEGEPWKTFKGFVTEEEMTMLVKHVEIPQRSPYSKECPQRPYECMISTIKKLPWYMSNHITVRQRHAVYNATIKLVALLIQALQRMPRLHETVINEQLLKRLSTAAMLCPGFSVVQKDNIAVVAHLDENHVRLFNQPRFADMWTHLHALCPKPNTPLDVLEWYIAIVREETARHVARQSITHRNEIHARGGGTGQYFGYLWCEMDLPIGKQFDGVTLRDLARREAATMERILRRAFPYRN